MNLEKKIHSLFIAKKQTLSLAESCTGGALSYRFVQIPDCSLYFLGSIVAYSNDAKKHILGVRAATIETFGAVSEETAKEMARGALNRFGSTYAVATSGIAGPSGGTEQKPIGTICFAIAIEPDDLHSWTSHFEGERNEIIEAGVKETLQHLYDITSR
ncbi:MAG: CinA family protein [Chlamydiales bacterium]